MTWLLAHMWIVVAATGLVAIVLGWSIRGTLLSGKMRQAIVERDMVKVELGHSKEEVEKLFAQIKKLSNGETTASTVADPILARKVEALTAELARKATEMDALKAAAAAVPAVAGAEGGEGENPLIWRNRHLESRLTQLEADLANASAQTPAPPVAPAPEPVGGVDAAKQAWEVGYLRTRVEALQTELAAVPAAAPAPQQPATVAAAAADGEAAAPAEEELSRLRWRVRFLEGRLAYFEGGAAPAEAASPGSEPAPAAAPHVSDAILGQLQAADDQAEAEASGQIERVRPVALDKPVDGKADDLTLIGGIGPKIRDVLNSLGIYHFDQIADWAPENVAWIDEYLSFSGRITREGWVEQAAVLVGEAAEA